MPFGDWLGTSWGSVPAVLVSAVGLYAALIALTRIQGLRSFSTASAFDFAMTVAIGSALASTILSEDPPLARAVVAIAALYALQYIVAWGRRRSGRLKAAVDNEPLLLMADGEVIHEHMRSARIVEDDLIARLRQANVKRRSEVRAVVMETTGTFSVITGDPGQDVEDWLLNGVRGADRLRGGRSVSR